MENNINILKYLLMRKGERKEDGFYAEFLIDDKNYLIFLSYPYDLNGIEKEVLTQCFKGHKRMRIIDFKLIEEKDLKKMIEILNK